MGSNIKRDVVRYEGQVNDETLTCSFSAAAFALSNFECFSRYSNSDGRWHSDQKWHRCHTSEVATPWDALSGLNAGNWSTTAGEQPEIQTLPSWPSESFFVIP